MLPQTLPHCLESVTFAYTVSRLHRRHRRIGLLRASLATALALAGTFPPSRSTFHLPHRSCHAQPWARTTFPTTDIDFAQRARPDHHCPEQPLPSPRFLEPSRATHLATS